MLKPVVIVAVLLLAVARSCAPSHPAPGYGTPVAVAIQGYTGDAMEPFLSRDGQYLFFNDRNDPGVDTNLFYARRVNDTTFTFRGPVAGANSTALDAVASMDTAGSFYFVSTRSYDQSRSTIYRATFSNGSVSNVGLVPGISKLTAGWVNFDAEISPDGTTLYFVDSQFGATGQPVGAQLVIARKTGTGFTRLADSATLLVNVNATDSLQYAPAISKDGLELFFTRAKLPIGSASPRIMVATRSAPTDPFGAPTVLPSLTGFVEAPALSADGQGLYFHRLVGTHYVIYRAPRL